MSRPAAGGRTASRRAATSNSSGLRGSPHSSHSVMVSGMSASSIVVTTSTNGTSATTARHRSGRWLNTAPCRRPPALSPRDASREPSTSPCQPVRDGDVVVEGVLLVLQVAVEPPATAVLATAADVRVHEHHAAVEEARQRRVPLRLVDGLVGAVAVEQGRRGAVEGSVAVPDQGGGHRGAVRGGEAPRLADVRRRVVTGRVLAVPLGPLAGVHVDVRPDGWVHVGLVHDRQRPRVEVLVVPELHRPSRPATGIDDEARRRGRGCVIAQPVPTTGAEAQHHVTGEGVDAE